MDVPASAAPSCLGTQWRDHHVNSSLKDIAVVKLQTCHLVGSDEGGCYPVTRRNGILYHTIYVFMS